jgi:aryl-alcohol dehydrogenase-like predicted oxidoreductase
MNLVFKKIDYYNKDLLNKIFQWRNDEITRKFSNNTNIITEEIFDIIISKYQESNIDPIIMYLDNIEVGLFSFSKSDDKIYIGININPEYRNKKIGSFALKKLIEMKKELINTDIIFASVKKDNTASINLFNKYFTFKDENDNFKNFYLNINESMIDKLIIGTVQFGLKYGITNKQGKVTDSDLDNIFSFCNNFNITHFDTAQDYGNSEDIIKKYKDIYENIVIITKCKLKNKPVKETIELSINKFYKINYFLLHSYDDYNIEAIETLTQFKKLNKIHKIGVSIYNVEEGLKILKENKIDAIQLPFNYLDKQWFNKEFQDLLKKTNIEIHVRSIFLQGILLNPIVKKPSNISEEDFSNLNNCIDEICEELKLSKLELCFAYINSFDWIDKFLIGIDNYDHLLLNYEIMKNNKKLNEVEIEYIKIKVKNINPLICNPVGWLF